MSLEGYSFFDQTDANRGLFLFKGLCHRGLEKLEGGGVGSGAA